MVRSFAMEDKAGAIMDADMIDTKPTADMVNMMDHFRRVDQFLGFRGSSRLVQVTRVGSSGFPSKLGYRSVLAAGNPSSRGPRNPSLLGVAVDCFSDGCASGTIAFSASLTGGEAVLRKTHRGNQVELKGKMLIDEFNSEKHDDYIYSRSSPIAVRWEA